MGLNFEELAAGRISVQFVLGSTAVHAFDVCLTKGGQVQRCASLIQDLSRSNVLKCPNFFQVKFLMSPTDWLYMRYQCSRVLVLVCVCVSKDGRRKLWVHSSSRAQ